MEQSQDPIEDILVQLKNKVLVKKKTYKNLIATFEGLQQECLKVVEGLCAALEADSDKVEVALTSISKHEFHIEVGGDLLVFLMPSNIITLDKSHGVMQSEYVNENDYRKFFGQILVYNFMTDSVRFNRLNDPGYLLARIFINVDNFFFAEGQGQFGFLFSQISNRPIEALDFSVLSKVAIDLAIKTDLMALRFADIKDITLMAKENHTQLLGSGKKIGFKMAYDEDIKS